MKSKLTFLAALIVLGVVFSSCKKKTEEPKSDEQIQLEKLTGTWAVPAGPPANAVTFQSNDLSSDWSSFTITFTDGSFSTTGNSYSPEVWPTSGSWSFANGDVNTLMRGDGIDINISVSETTLTMSFTYTTPGGRLNGVDGSWVFNNLQKQ